MSDQEAIPGEEGIDAQVDPNSQMGMPGMMPNPTAMPPSPAPGMNMDAPMPMPGMPGQPQPMDPLMAAPAMSKKMVSFMSKKGKINFMAKDAPKHMKDVFQHCMLKM